TEITAPVKLIRDQPLLRQRVQRGEHLLEQGLSTPSANGTRNHATPLDPAPLIVHVVAVARPAHSLLHILSGGQAASWIARAAIRASYSANRSISGIITSRAYCRTSSTGDSRAYFRQVFQASLPMRRHHSGSPILC